MSIRSIAHSTALVILLATTASIGSFAQTPRAAQGAVQPQGQQAAPPADMERMMRNMREMMPMMERMHSASPQERAQMMERMAPMMRDMMPMMQSMMGGQDMIGGQGMMGGQGMGMGAMTGPGHQGHGQTSTTATPSTRAFEEANAKMHRDMAIAFSGNADIDFVRGMIPHHQGAIDMARVVLQSGMNEQTKKWANEIIVAQEREIAEMREWLVSNPR